MDNEPGALGDSTPSWLRGLSVKEYLATRDPVSGTVYYVMLGVFAIMPLLVARE